MKASHENEYECLPQYLSALAVSFSACVVGGWMSFTSVAIPKMMANSSETVEANISILGSVEEEDAIIIDLHEGSWIASLFFIGNIVGCLAGGFINQKLGSRKVFLISAPLSGLTWVMVALSHQLWLILVARVISGIIF